MVERPDKDEALPKSQDEKEKPERPGNAASPKTKPSARKKPAETGIALRAKDGACEPSAWPSCRVAM
jgi:hypothetical protein